MASASKGAAAAARRLGCAVGILALGLLTMDAAWHGLVAARALRGQVAMDAWLRTPARMALWTDAHTHLAAAAGMDEDDPRLNEDLGSLIAELARQPGVGYALHASLWRESLGIFRTGVRQRPAWPYAWGQIAVLKHRLMEFDEEYYDALRRTAELGPAEPILQRVVVEMGLDAWPRLGIAERAAVKGMLRRGLEMDRAGMMSAIRRVRGQELACATAELRVLIPDLACNP